MRKDSNVLFLYPGLKGGVYGVFLRGLACLDVEE
jgi:hypothetical protein